MPATGRLTSGSRRHFRNPSVPAQIRRYEGAGRFGEPALGLRMRGDRARGSLP